MNDQPHTVAGNPAAQPYVDDLERQERERQLLVLNRRAEHLRENLREAEALVSGIDSELIEVETQMAALLHQGRR